MLHYNRVICYVINYTQRDPQVLELICIF